MHTHNYINSTFIKRTYLVVNVIILVVTLLQKRRHSWQVHLTEVALLSLLDCARDQRCSWRHNKRTR